MLSFILAFTFGAPPDLPSADLRLTLLENARKTQAKWNDEATKRIEALEAENRALRKRTSLCPCIVNAEANWVPTVTPSMKAANCPCGIPGCQCGCAAGGVCTCLQAKAVGTTCTIDPVTGQMSCGPSLLTPPPYMSAPMQHPAYGGCANGSCGPSRGGFRLFGGRRR